MMIEARRVSVDLDGCGTPTQIRSWVTKVASEFEKLVRFLENIKETIRTVLFREITRSTHAGCDVVL